MQPLECGSLGYMRCVHYYHTLHLLPLLLQPQKILETIFEVLIMKEPHIVEENPNKPNIAYVVKYMERNVRLSDYFHWIAKEVIDKHSMATRTIIYCQTIKQCAVVYSTLKTLIGDKIYVGPQNKDLKRVVLEMLHSCSPN